MSVKLLNFDPQKQESGKMKSTFFELFSEDIWFGCTPDLPKLRMFKKHKVFLWDNLKVSYALVKKFGVPESEVDTVNYLARTKDSFLPFINKNPNAIPYNLPASPSWYKSIPELDFKGYVPKPVSGMILEVSTRVLQHLDVHYSNDMIRQRVRIPIRTTDSEVYCWAYLLPTQNFTKYDPHEQSYSLQSTFDPKPCPVNFQQNSPEGVFHYCTVTSV